MIGTSYFIDGLTAAFLGGMMIRFSQPNVLGTATAILLLAVLMSGSALLGWPDYERQIIKGVLLLIGVIVAGRLRQADVRSPGQVKSMSQRCVVGLDGGTGGARAMVVTVAGEVLAVASSPYETRYPRPGWAEQSHDDWWRASALAVRQAISEAGVDPVEVDAICADGTSSTVVALDVDERPTRPAILWMDNRASAQARRIMETGHPALSRSKIGVSSEWELPKLLWMKANQPEIFERSRWFVEMADYLALKLSGTVDARPQPDHQPLVLQSTGWRLANEPI